MTSVPVERHTSSNALVNLASRSRIRNLHAVAPSPRPTTMFRACWATHHPVGCGVTPARCTRRLPSSIKNRTYNRRRKTVSTVKKSQARMPVACWCRNDRQLGAPWRRAKAVGTQHPPDRAGRHPNAKAQQLAMDALVAPARVLAGKPDDQLLDVVREPGPWMLATQHRKLVA